MCTLVWQKVGKKVATFSRISEPLPAGPSGMAAGIGRGAIDVPSVWARACCESFTMIGSRGERWAASRGIRGNCAIAGGRGFVEGVVVMAEMVNASELGVG
jgi:hypothetical protein